MKPIRVQKIDIKNVGASNSFVLADAKTGIGHRFQWTSQKMFSSENFNDLMARENPNRNKGREKTVFIVERVGNNLVPAEELQDQMDCYPLSQHERNNILKVRSTYSCTLNRQ